MIDNDRVAEVLETAADKLESGEWGWTVGDYHIGNSYCSVGALQAAAMAAGDVWLSDQATNAMRPHVIDRVMDRVNSDRHQYGAVPIGPEEMPSNSAVITFNDILAEGVHDVVEVMKLGAKDLRNQS